MIVRTAEAASLDKRRVHAVFGRVSPQELDRIDDGLRLYLGLAAT